VAGVNIARALGQFPTPVWFAERIVAKYFPALDRGDLVLEPSCGAGAFLHALPAHVPAIGVEWDPVLADQARLETGRPVITGDFRAVSIDVEPTAIIGNPPFRIDLIEGFLARAHELLPAGGRAGFILPAFAFQTAARVVRFAERWSIAQDLIPRNVFDRISVPLVFAVFSKDRRRALVGLALYHDADDVLRMPTEYRDALAAGVGVWRRLVLVALRRLGGRARLPEIYAELEGRRPGTGQWWREKVRQTLRVYANDFAALGEGHYELRKAA
jgi:hypothetical protein